MVRESLAKLAGLPEAAGDGEGVGKVDGWLGGWVVGGRTRGVGVAGDEAVGCCFMWNARACQFAPASSPQGAQGPTVDDLSLS